MFRSAFMSFLIVFLPQVLCAKTVEEAFSEYKNYASSLKNKPQDTMNAFNPKETFKERYTENPTEANLYKGLDEEKSDIEKRALLKAAQDETSKIIITEADKHHFEKNDLNPAIQYAKVIESQSEKGFSQGSHCEDTPKICKTIPKIETCLVSKPLPDKECIKRRVVTVDKESKHMHIDAEVMIHKNWRGVVDIHLADNWASNVIYTRIGQPLGFDHGCRNVTVTQSTIRNNAIWPSWATITQMPNCANHGIYSIYVGRKFKRDYPLQIAIDLNLDSDVFEVGDKWEDDCSNASLNYCHIKENSCLSPNQTRFINGLSVTKNCWEEKKTYACSYSNADNCQSQKAKGCMQTASSCNQFLDGKCIEYKQTYSCTDTQCVPSVPCIKKVFCADGACSPKTEELSDDFADNISKLGALGAAASDFQKTQSEIFKGHIKQCKVIPLDFIDCCSSKGWGKALNLSHCSLEDKDLGHAKQEYLDHYLGTFCSKRELGICVERKRTYCVFDSKMARILQEARLKQKGDGILGSAKEPKCDGMSVDDLQEIDFKKVEFIEPIYPAGFKQQGAPNKDAGVVPPNPNMNEAEMRRRIERWAAK